MMTSPNNNVFRSNRFIFVINDARDFRGFSSLDLRTYGLSLDFWTNGLAKLKHKEDHCLDAGVLCII